MAAGVDGTIRIDSKIDTKGMGSGIDAIVGKLKVVAAAIAAAFAIKKLVDFTKSIALISAEFQRLGIAAQAVGQTFGVAAAETRRLVAELVSMGIQTDVANRSFIEFTRAGLDNAFLPALARGAQDLAVFAQAGESSSEVMDRLLHGIITLNPIVLRQAGVIVDMDTAYKNWAKTQKITVGNMTAENKQAAALEAVMSKLAGAQGLYELSQKTAAGQMSSNVRIMNEFRAAMGDVLQPAFFTLIKSFNDLIKVMTAAIKPGGMLRNIFVQIGAAAAVVASIIAGLFRMLASLFGGVGGGTTGARAVDRTGAAVQELADSSGAAAEAQDDLADSTKAAGKAAKGALAAFDDLNVLQQESADGGAGAADVGAAGALDFGEIDASQFLDPMKEIADRAEILKERLANFAAPLVTAFNEHLLPALEKLGAIAFTGLQWAWENVLKPFGKWVIEELGPKVLELLGEWLNLFGVQMEELGPIAEEIWDNVLKPAFEDAGDAIIIVLDWLIERMRDLNAWIEDNGTAWRIIMIVLMIAVTAFALVASGIGAVGLIIVGLIVILATWRKAWNMFIDLLKLAMVTAFNVGKAIGTSIKDMLITIKDGFRNAFDSVVNIVKGALNRAIDFVNSFINRVVGGVNSIIGAINSVGSILPGFSNVGYVTGGNIPRLAAGAVIPPNANFLAVLGDQRSGRNIEAPEGLIRQIIQEEIGNVKAEIEISFSGSLASLVRELKPHIDRENVRIGGSLISSGVSAK